jgi:hypothetical protein
VRPEAAAPLRASRHAATQLLGADLVVSTARSSAVGIILTPPKLERVPTWGAPDHSANLLENRAIRLRHVSSPCFIYIDLHKESGDLCP